MKVLHLFNDYLPNSMNWAANLITNTPDADLYVGASRFLKTNFFAADVAYIEFPLREGEWPTGWRFAPVLDRGTRWMRRHFYPLFLRARIGDVDIIHCHFATAGWEFLRFRKYFQHARLVVSFYGYDYEQVPRRHPSWMDRYRLLFEQVDKFLCEGEHGIELLTALGAPTHKLKVCRLGISPERIAFVSRTKRRGELRLLQVATLTEKKGHVYSLRAFASAYSDCPDMTLAFVGLVRDAEGADILSALKREVRALGLDTRVRFLSAVPYELLHGLFADFHVFIHPSTYSENRDCEGGAPVVLLDAQATGMPVIATHHCDIPSEVIHAETGLLAAERDVGALAAHIRRFYEMDQPEYDTFASAARRHVETAFDVKQNGKLLRSIYGETLADPR
jgi:colanic acid/amylovoran biosynthesis glycosyltransferase